MKRCVGVADKNGRVAYEGDLLTHRELGGKPTPIKFGIYQQYDRLDVGVTMVVGFYIDVGHGYQDSAAHWLKDGEIVGPQEPTV